MNKKIEKERPELNPIPVKSPWFHLGIDFIGPISPPSSAGNRYQHTSTPQKPAKLQFGYQNTAAKELMFKLRQKVSKKPPSEPIDVESLQLSSKGQQAKADKTWIHTELYCLLQSDRDILLNPAAWLNDNIVSAVQKLLKQQLPVTNGFQDPCCGLTYVNVGCRK